MAPTSETARQRLLSSLRGQTLVLPDICKFLEHWPQYINPEIERLREEVDDRLSRQEDKSSSCSTPS